VRIGLTIAGGIVGGLFGQPQLGLMVGSLVGGVAERVLSAPEAEVVEGPKPGELRIQNCSYGVPIPWYWGTVRAAGNLIAGPYVEDVRVEQEVGGGGGVCGGPPEQVQVTYVRYATFAVGLCRGPITRIARVWANSKLIYDLSETTGKAVQMDGLNMTVYPGDETQQPDPYLEAEEGEGQVPAHRGLAYVVFYRMPLSEFGNNLPLLNFEIQVDATASVPVLGVDPGHQSHDGIWRTPDDQWMIIEHSNHWYRFNVVTGEEVIQVDHDADKIPGVYHGFHDIDERGHIYTAKYSRPNYNYAVKLDLDFNLIATGPELPATEKATVIRNPRYPYVWYTKAGGGCYVLHRDSLASANAVDDYTAISPPSGKEAKMIAVDHTTGTVYVLYATNTVSADTIVRVYPADGDSYDEYDLSAYIYWGAVIAFDETSNQVIIGSHYDLSGGTTYRPVAFFDGDTLAHLATIQQDLVTSYNVSAFQSGVRNGCLYTLGGSRVNKINVNSRSVTTYDTNSQTGGTGYGLCYDPVCHAVWQAVDGASSVLYKCLLDRGTGDAVTLGSIVADICAEVDLQGGAIDVSALTDNVRGYMVEARMAARQAIQPLMDTFFFDGVESDTKLKFVKRGGASAASIAEADLAAHPGGQQRPQTLPRPIRQEVELPVQVDVTYINPEADYQLGNQRTRKLTTNSSNMPNLRLPVVLGDDEAKQVAYTHLSAAWLGRFLYSFQLARKYFYLEPTDVVTVTKGSEEHVVRIVSMRYQGGVLAVEAVKEDATIYSNSFGGASAPAHAPVVHYPGPSYLEIIDCPALEDVQDKAGLYLAACGYSEYWRGCVVYKSNDGDMTWSSFATLQSAAVMGKCSTALGDFGYTHWDGGNSVTVRLSDPDATLSSCSKAQALEGANACLIGDEILHFTTPTEESDGSYTLSGLLRGRRGTEWATGTHAVGDRFVLLTVPGVFFEEISLSEENSARVYKGVSIGQMFAKAPEQTVTALIRTLMPYSPVHIAGSRDGSYNLTVSWVRRTRIGGHWADGHDVPLGEESESYEVDILDKDGAVVRTISAGSESAAYSAADQNSEGPWYAFGADGTDWDWTNVAFPSANYKSVCKFTAPQAFNTVSALKVYWKNDYGSAKVKGVIYADSNGAPGALLATSNEVSGVTAGWTTLGFASNVTLAAGDYWIGVIADTTMLTDGWGSTGENRYNADTYSDGPADPFGTPTSSTTRKPIYAVTHYAERLTVGVYQLSASVGRGFGGQAVI